MFRILRIIFVISKYLLASQFIPYRYNLRKKAKLLRECLEDLGGAFIKFGQLLALRVDLLPIEYCQELIFLFDRVPSFSFSQVKEIFQRDLGTKLEERFLSVEENPLAAASFAQVHKAILPNNQEVVIKVQRPNVDKTLKVDLILLSGLIYLLNLVIKTKIIYLKDVLSEFKKWTKQELDFQIEAVNCQKIYQNLQGNQVFVVPRIFPEFTSRHLLVQEYLPGLPFTTILEKAINGTLDKNELRQQNIDLYRASHQIAFEFIRQYFVDGIYHADPHPGNIILMKNGKIGLVDFGIVATVNADIQNFYHFMKAATINENYQKASYYLLQFASRHFIRELGIITKEKNVDQLVNDLATNYYQSLKDLENTYRGKLHRKEMEYTGIFLRVARFGQRYNLRLPNDFVLLLRAMSFLGIEMKIVEKRFRLTKALELFFQEYPPDAICQSGPPEKEIFTPLDKALENVTSWASSILETDLSLYKQVKNYLGQYAF